MEPYRNYGRGGYGRSNSSCNMNPNQRGNNMNSNMNSHMHQNNNSSCGCSSSPKPDSSCDCKDSNPHMRHMPIAMAYVPMQKWSELNSPETALCQGTAFPELNLIFCGSRGKM